MVNRRIEVLVQITNLHNMLWEIENLKSWLEIDNLQNLIVKINCSVNPFSHMVINRLIIPTEIQCKCIVFWNGLYTSNHHIQENSSHKKFFQSHFFLFVAKNVFLTCVTVTRYIC